MNGALLHVFSLRFTTQIYPLKQPMSHRPSEGIEELREQQRPAFHRQAKGRWQPSLSTGFKKS